MRKRRNKKGVGSIIEKTIIERARIIENQEDTSHAICCNDNGSYYVHVSVLTELGLNERAFYRLLSELSVDVRKLKIERNTLYSVSDLSEALALAGKTIADVGRDKRRMIISDPTKLKKVV